VPSESYDDFVDKLASLVSGGDSGVEVQEQATNVQDVTSSYIDVVSRIIVLESSEKVRRSESFCDIFHSSPFSFADSLCSSQALRRLMESASTTLEVLDVEKVRLSPLSHTTRPAHRPAL